MLPRLDLEEFIDLEDPSLWEIDAFSQACPFESEIESLTPEEKNEIKVSDDQASFNETLNKGSRDHNRYPYDRVEVDGEKITREALYKRPYLNPGSNELLTLEEKKQIEVRDGQAFFKEKLLTYNKPLRAHTKDKVKVDGKIITRVALYKRPYCNPDTNEPLTPEEKKQIEVRDGQAFFNERLLTLNKAPHIYEKVEVDGKTITRDALYRRSYCNPTTNELLTPVEKKQIEVRDGQAFFQGLLLTLDKAPRVHDKVEVDGKTITRDALYRRSYLNPFTMQPLTHEEKKQIEVRDGKVYWGGKELALEEKKSRKRPSLSTEEAEVPTVLPHTLNIQRSPLLQNSLFSTQNISRFNPANNEGNDVNPSKKRKY